MDQRQDLEKLATLREFAAAAVRSNPEEPAYQLASVAFQLNMDAGEAINPAEDEPTLDRLAKSLDALLPQLAANEYAIDRAIALRLRGDIHAYKSRLVACRGPIDRSIKSALDTYTAAIQAFQDLPPDSRNSSYRRLRSHFADCYLGRSSMHIDWANKVVAKKATADRRVALQQSLKDAREFEKLAPARGDRPPQRGQCL